MIESESYEPYVLLERPEPAGLQTRTPRRWTVLRGHKPAILLVDEPTPDRSGLDALLASEGFGVYRTASRDSALELLRTHPSVLMAVVRMDLRGIDPGSLIRELRGVHPGLWVGMRAEAGDTERASAGYAAGAVDLFHRSSDPRETVVRLIRSVPLAARMQDAAARAQERREQRSSGSGARRLLRKASAKAGLVVTLTAVLIAGITAALVTQSWLETRDAWSARMDRLLGALEAPRPVFENSDRQFDRWQRTEQLRFQREDRQALRASQDDQFREDRLRDLFRAVPPPTYR